MTARNDLERKVLEMVQRGEKLHGFARDVLIDMTLREKEEAENAASSNK